MRRILAYSFLAAFSVGLSGCVLFFENDDDDDWDDCLYPPGDGGGAPLELRNPETGLCEYIGGGGGWCDPNCGACDQPAEADNAAVALPSWGYCSSFCSGLDEATCLDTQGCRGGYIDTCPPNADCDITSLQFYECWSVDMTGPVSDGSCEGLDAWSCSQHDNCRAVHENACGTTTDPNGDAEEPGLADPIPTCLGYFQTCLPETPEVELGNCYDEVTCRALPPECPVGTLPGVINGCWTGYCIPEAQCEAPPTCDALTEPQCIGRSDCDTLYTGVDCVCDANGCECADWVYEGCQDM